MNQDHSRPLSLGPAEEESLFRQVPNEYYRIPAAELQAKCMAAKATLGKDLVILAHHYQQNDVYTLADFTGDSLKLAQEAAKSQAKYIVFCGVHFMAESADILTRDDQMVMLPNLTAGCSMADMADVVHVEEAWDQIMEATGNESLIPITYINSTAAIKAFVALHGGTVCTSSNAKKILQWAFTQGKRVFFVPDQHLGRNASLDLGLPQEQVVLWQRALDDGGLSPVNLRQSRVILWDGFCSVHQRFTPGQVAEVRKRIPGVQVMVHPECPRETVLASDFNGSTTQIIDKVRAAAPGSKWAIGTEINMVHRLSQEMKAQNKYVEVLNPLVCICSTMYRNHPAHIAWVLDNLLQGQVIHRITVPEPTKTQARAALAKMLELSR